MAHKFAHRFHSSIVMIVDGKPEKIDDGILDLSAMNAGGILETGLHSPTVGFPSEITAKAEGETLTINHKGKPDLYVGILVFEDASEKRLILSGLFDKDTTNNDRVKKALSQDEGVWVITKP